MNIIELMIRYPERAITYILSILVFIGGYQIMLWWQFPGLHWIFRILGYVVVLGCALVMANTINDAMRHRIPKRPQRSTTTTPPVSTDTTNDDENKDEEKKEEETDVALSRSLLTAAIGGLMALGLFQVRPTFVFSGLALGILIGAISGYSNNDEKHPPGVGIGILVGTIGLFIIMILVSLVSTSGPEMKAIDFMKGEFVAYSLLISPLICLGAPYMSYFYFWPKKEK